MRFAPPPAPDEEASELTLDPDDWHSFGRLAHEIMDVSLDYVRSANERRVWTPPPGALKQALAEALPSAGQGARSACEQLVELVLPYATGNLHPRFYGWVHGCGTGGGLLAELLAAAMNANLGGRDHGAVYVERQVVEWCRELFGFPEGASGILVSGTSMATLIGLTVARNALAGRDVKAEGLGGDAGRLVGYASAEAHGSIARAFEILGLGRNALRPIATDARYRMRLADLRRAIERDQAEGLQPFCVIGTAGTVNTGAIDDLAAIAAICDEHQLWFHVDGAFGALAVLSDRLRPRLIGIERADSLAFDFHKWMHVSYDAGCALVRRGDLHRDAFSMQTSYLTPHARGLAGGEPWFCEFGPELSRCFRALKVWFAFKEHGTRRLGEVIERNCNQARELARRIGASPDLELLAPVELNIVCFRFHRPEFGPEALDRLNTEIVADLQESGLAAPSTTIVGGRRAIRVNLTNHRTRSGDLDLLLAGILTIGARRSAARDEIERAGGPPPRCAEAMPAALRRIITQICERPEITPLAHGLCFDLDPTIEMPFRVHGGRRISVRPSSFAIASDAAVLIRHALELALWQRLAADSAAAGSAALDIAACRVAALYRSMESPPARHASGPAMPGWLLEAYDVFGAASLPREADLRGEELRLLVGKLRRLRKPADADQASGPDLSEAAERLAELSRVALPTEHLLLAGGGTRLALHPRTGLNGYGAAPRPRSGALALASSTTSTISEHAYGTTETLRQALIGAALTDRSAGLIEAEIDHQKSRLLLACGLDPCGGAEVILTPSGTDGEFAALHLARGDAAAPIVNILMAPDETGSGVRLAAQGRHFCALTTDGATIQPGAPVTGISVETIDSRTVEIRRSEGQPRPAAEIDAEVRQLVTDAVGSGGRCLLHVLDCSKSGLRAPSLELARELQQRHEDHLRVVVDACQMRLGPARLGEHLGAGFMVLITGSKFYMGPSFAGALLIPRSLAGRLAASDPLPVGLCEYFSRAEWPGAWTRATRGLPERSNLGLLLRWHAALAEMEVFGRIPSPQRMRIMSKLAEAARGAIEASESLKPVVIGQFDDTEMPQTIFPFQILRRSARARRVPMDFGSLQSVHAWMNQDVSEHLPADAPHAVRQLAATPCHLGQPVKLGAHVAALRLCIGARLVAEVASDRALGHSWEERLECQIARIRAAVRKVELIATYLDHLVTAAAA